MLGFCTMLHVDFCLCRCDFAPCSKSDKATGLPLEVRQAMYGSRWDKVLVDCRRTVDYTTNGKKEVYTSMVAVGNMKVGWFALKYLLLPYFYSVIVLALHQRGGGGPHEGGLMRFHIFLFFGLLLCLLFIYFGSIPAWWRWAT